MSPPNEPAPLDLLVVGAGFAGLYMLHKARKLGLRVRAVEAAPGVGGTWTHNRYPGARVDIESLEYSYSFDEALQQQWRWTERYAAQPELLAYANHVAGRFGLREQVDFGTRIEAAHFDEAARAWQVRASDGQHWRARFVVMASGPLSAPSAPRLPGLADFGGTVLHTAGWPHEGVDLRGKRVAVIGTGSSAVQAIPLLAEQAEALTVFQRTPAYCVPARNGPLDPAYEARIKADYAGFRARNRQMFGGFGSELPPNRVSALQVSAAEREAMFGQRWQVGGFSFLGAFNDLLTNLESNALAAEYVRARIRETVHDPETARALCPSQPIGCKRLCVDTGYYATFNRPNVRLVDLNAQPLEGFTRDAVVAGGERRRVDAVVLATGFDAVTGSLLKIDLRGRDGVPIRQKWAGGPVNYLGLGIAGFPNLFHLVGPGSTAAFTNVIVAIEHHVEWVADCIAWLDARGHATIEPTPEAEADWVAYVVACARGTVFLGCNSWYLGANIPGKPRMFMPLASSFPGYVRRCAEVADAGYAGFALG